MSNAEDLGFLPNMDVKLLIDNIVVGNRRTSGALSNSSEGDIRRMLHGTQFTPCSDVDFVVLRVV